MSSHTPRKRRTWRQRTGAVAVYTAIFTVVGTLSFGAILAYRRLSIPLADRISTNPILSVRPTMVPVWVDPVILEPAALFGLYPIPLVAAIGLWVGPVIAVTLGAGLVWWWSDPNTSARLPPLSRLGYLVGYAFVTVGVVHVLTPPLRELGTEISETELTLLIGVLIVATLLWIGIILAIALVSVWRGKDASLWSMPLSRFEYAAIYAGAIVVALLAMALGSWSTPRLEQVSWVGIAGALGIVAVVVVAGRLFVAPVTIIRDGRGPIEAIRWSNSSIANSGMTTRTVLIVFWVGVFVRWAAHLTTVASNPVVGLALATVVGTALVGSLHALLMVYVYRDVQRDVTSRSSITELE